jgi:hypothetical protein
MLASAAACDRSAAPAGGDAGGVRDSAPDLVPTDVADGAGEPDGFAAAAGPADVAPTLHGAGIATVGGTAITADDKRISDMGFGAQVTTCAGDVCVTGGLSP